MFNMFAWVLALSATATADECAVTFSDGWAPQAPPVATMWAGYGVLRNGSPRAVTLTGASTPDFAMAQIHETREENGVEHMRRIDSLELPAGGEVRFAPGGKHLMLMRPSHDLAKSAAIEIEFRVDGCVAPVKGTLPIRRDQDK